LGAEDGIELCVRAVVKQRWNARFVERANRRQGVHNPKVAALECRILSGGDRQTQVPLDARPGICIDQ